MAESHSLFQCKNYRDNNMQLWFINLKTPLNQSATEGSQEYDCGQNMMIAVSVACFSLWLFAIFVIALNQMKGVG